MGAAENKETKIFCQGDKRLGCHQEKSCSMGIVVEYNMNTAVDMDGVRRKVEMRKRVMKHRRLFCKDVPVELGYAIACFTTMDCSEIDGAMNVGIKVSEIKPTTKGHTLAF